MLAFVCRSVSRFRVTPCRMSRSFTFALVALAALGGQAFASNTAVGLCAAPGNHYLTIQAAVNAAEALAIPRTVRVCPGIYAEQVMITSSLTIEGIVNSTSDAAVVVPPSGGIAMNGSDIFGNPVAAQIFVASTSGSVTVSHLTVDGTGNNMPGCVATTLEGIYFQNTSGTISANSVRNQYQTDYADFGGCQNGLAINVESLGSNSVTVANNSVHAYQKNGITATGAATGPGSLGPAVIISGNYIVGLGATAMNWQGVYVAGDSTAAENGVQIGFGASGSVTGNVVNDNIWGQDTGGDTGDAASGILIYASTNIAVTGNEVGSAQLGIVAVTDPTYGPADSTLITGNKVAGTQLFDAIDLCSNSNNVHTNTIYGSTESGIHIDDSCGSGNNNVVSGNTINEACAGILLGTGSSNTSLPNTFANVTNTTLAGDVCPAGPDANSTVGGSKKAQRLRPAPYKAVKK
jgi:hypothetical protein